MLALAAAGPGAAATPAPVRAHYEVTLEQGRSRWTIGSGAEVRSGIAIRHDIGPYRLALVPRLEGSGHYTLSVSVGLLPKGVHGVYAPDSLSFGGQLASPLEFTATLAATKVTGAIMIAPVGQAAAP